MRSLTLTVAAIALAYAATSFSGCGSLSTAPGLPDGGGGASGALGSAYDGSDSAGAGPGSVDGNVSIDGQATVTDSAPDLAIRDDGSAGSQGGGSAGRGTAAGGMGASGSGGVVDGGAAGSGGSGPPINDPAFCPGHPDGTLCDDGDECTDADVCGGGACVGATPSETITAHQIAIACPANDTASDGMVATTCDFPGVLSPNNVYTGPVVLVSHLDRDFANSDVNSLSDGRVQLICVYKNSDGLVIGGIYRFVIASSCTATSAAGFACAK